MFLLKFLKIQASFSIKFPDNLNNFIQHTNRIKGENNNIETMLSRLVTTQKVKASVLVEKRLNRWQTRRRLEIFKEKENTNPDPIWTSWVTWHKLDSSFSSSQLWKHWADIKIQYTREESKTAVNLKKLCILYWQAETRTSLVSFNVWSIINPERCKSEFKSSKWWARAAVITCSKKIKSERTHFWHRTATFISGRID